MRDTYRPDEENSIVFAIAGHHHEFCDVAPDALEPVALRLDRDLVADLTGAKAPVSDEIEAEIRRHTLYLDLGIWTCPIGR
ncbi:hypothetical protein [Azospirillum soli]|uniref:hypothetical protein n=1 Tax=Azospirillum soli TaxID=1304799 RepID=UPI001AE8280E|nr:hypothetical protein [Azospirillum soli]MBP2315549.1 hypothetical protein [Azospirillum soli]